MSDGFRASVVEVFPMRLGGETLVDLTLEVSGDAPFDPPRADDPVRFGAGGRLVDLTVWAAPALARPEGSRLVNVQFRREDLEGVELSVGMSVDVQP